MQAHCLKLGHKDKHVTKEEGVSHAASAGSRCCMSTCHKSGTALTEAETKDQQRNLDKNLVYWMNLAVTLRP